MPSILSDGLVVEHMRCAVGVDRTASPGACYCKRALTARALIYDHPLISRSTSERERRMILVSSNKEICTLLLATSECNMSQGSHANMVCC